MLTDIFWNIMTSYAMLGALGVLLLAALLVAHFPLIKWIPGIDQYVIAATIVAYLALAMLAFLVGFRIADERQVTRQLKVDLAWSENELEQQKATTEDKEKLASEKAAEADELKAKVSDYEATLAKQPIGDCALDDGDLGGLQSLRGRAAKHVRPNSGGLRRSRPGSPSP